MTYNIKTHGDFKIIYDTKLKRNYWLLGYFGGGAVNIHEAHELAKQYAEANNVPLETICIDEVLNSRRFKHFKYIYSTEIQEKGEDSYETDNVFEYLSF